MTFFNQKEEVMDIKLTQFGKDCLARGVFSPVYYQFFDDGILYNALNGKVSETQNQSEIRILKETPRLKTQHLVHSVESQYYIDDDLIIAGDRKRFESLRRNFDPDIQDKTLSYPLGEFDVQTIDFPRFSVLSLGAEMATGSVSYYTGSFPGEIIRKYPQIEILPELKIKRSEPLEHHKERITDEDHYDLTANVTRFSDGSSIEKEENYVLIDLQELNSFYGLDNFEIEVYEVMQTSEGESLVRIDTSEEISKRFEIKTDGDIEELEREEMHQTNYRKRGED